jgi:signal recognition particle subunit SRP54
MFDSLTDRLGGTFRKLKARGKLHPKQVDNALQDIRTALLDADVSLDVVEDFLGRVRDRALSDEVMKSLTPAQQVIKVVREELQTTLGGEHVPFTLPGVNPVVIMMAGVQGSGKTTHSAKLALHLKEKGRQPLLVAADLQRPAAIEQLFTLGREIGEERPQAGPAGGPQRRDRRHRRAAPRGPRHDARGAPREGRGPPPLRADGL